MSYDSFSARLEITIEPEACFGSTHRAELENSHIRTDNADVLLYWYSDFSAEPSDDPGMPEGRVSFSLSVHGGNVSCLVL